MTTQNPGEASVPPPARADVLIVGGGPAGSLLATMLARRGISVVLAEKQSTLERDFRGETLATPSAVSLRRLGFGPALREHGYLETTAVRIRLEGHPALHVDYSRLTTGALPIDIPQPALIRIFNDAGAAIPGFTYLSGWNCTGLLEEAGAVTGAVLRARDGTVASVAARIVIGADGRFSKVRKLAGLAPDVQPMTRDFLSFKLPRPPGWGSEAQLVVHGDRHLVILPTWPDFLRVGASLPKRGLGELRAAGFAAFAGSIAALDPRLAPLIREHLRSWDDTGFLEIFTAELGQWSRDGLLLIGDASHTCTPILGQGVNLAIQDVIALTPVLAKTLTSSNGVVPASALEAFVAARQSHKKHVTRFQRLQEAQLAVGSPRGVALRRARYRVLDALPLKYRLFAKVINVPHEIDPADERAGSVPPPAPAAVTPSGAASGRAS